MLSNTGIMGSKPPFLIQIARFRSIGYRGSAKRSKCRWYRLKSCFKLGGSTNSPCRALSDALQMAQITLSKDFMKIVRTILRSGEVERNLIVRLTTL